LSNKLKEEYVGQTDSNHVYRVKIEEGYLYRTYRRLSGTETIIFVPNTPIQFVQVTPQDNDLQEKLRQMQTKLEVLEREKIEAGGVLKMTQELCSRLDADLLSAEKVALDATNLLKQACAVNGLSIVETGGKLALVNEGMLSLSDDRKVRPVGFRF
jgi:hypothetical protein